MRRVLLSLILTMTALAGAAVPVGAQAADPQSEPEREPVTFDVVANLDELTDDHARVLRLYWAFFDRTPDAVGALYWIDRLDHCATMTDIATVFAEGPEFTATYGELDDAAFIDLVYANVLDRAPEAAGRDFWLGEIDAGRMTRVDVMLHFAYGDEFTASHALPSDGVPARACIGDVGPVGPRAIVFQDYAPFATVGDMELLLPSVAVELVGYHQSTHPGAAGMEPLDVEGTPQMLMDSRNRNTDRYGAADITVHPSFEIRSPVTGTVIRGGGYILYCQYRDDYVVIEPDAMPGWEVKVLHIDGLQVATGDRVIAGETVIAPTQTTFPFRSQIDEFTGNPSWGHVHIEVVDPSVPRDPSNSRPCP